LGNGPSPFRIWFERPPPPAYAQLLDGSAVIVGGTSSGETLEGIDEAHAIIASSRVRYDGELMDRIPDLRVISRTGIGLDNISLPDASERGIAVCHVPGGPTISTAEHAVALLLTVAKDLPRAAAALRMPVFVALAGRDTICDNRRTLRLLRRVTGQVDLVEYRRARHILEFSEQRAAFLDDLAGWLGSQGSR
jgi:lactate dehydrogenase-like 2-hydroxyacid dehydrogenase